MTIEQYVREAASILAPAVREAENKASRDVFGTAMVSASGAMVMLDGAASPVGCSFSVNCLDGDRVVCHIVNHRVVVFSNITNPDLSTAEVISHVKDYPNTGVIQNVVVSDSTLQDIDLHGFMATDGTIENTKISGGSIDGATLTNIPYAAIDELDAHSADIADARIGQATIKQAQVENLVADKAEINGKLTAAEGDISQLKANTADIATIRANSAKVQNLTAAELEADHAKVGTLDSDYAQINLANVNNAYIKNGAFDKAAVFDAAVFDLTGDTATIKEINADNITVRNLHTKNLTVDTADGYVTIGSKKTPTKEYIDSLKDELQQEIDGAVETFTADHVPLLNNYPASQWADDKTRAKHVGDICYVQKAGDEHDGFCYRFSYDSTSQQFSWVLIKDSSVTKALGDISDLKAFQSETSQWIEETDDGLTTIRENHTALSGVVDGVKATADAALPAGTFTQFESTTFKTVKDTVDTQSTKFEQLTTTLGTNADGTTKTGDIVHRTSDIEQDLSGFKTTVSETYATKSEAKQTDSDSGKREIATEDASELPLLTLTAYGECEQDGTPTPDSPVAIKAVRGRNLIPNIFDYSTTTNNVTCKRLDDGGIHLYGTASAQTDFYISRVESNRNVVKVPAGTYTFSARGLVTGVRAITSGGGTGYNGFPYQEFNGMDTSVTGTVTAGENPLHYIILRIAANTVVDTVVYLQFEAGTIAAPYVPYGCVAAMSHGKNYLKGCGGESTGNYPFGHSYNANPLPLGRIPASSTVAFSFNVVNPVANESTGIIIVYETGSSQSYYVSASTAGRKQTTITLDRNAIACGFYSTDSSIVVSDYQLELGTEATDYEPYRESVSYIDLQGHAVDYLDEDYGDKLYMDGSGHVTLAKRCGRKTIAERDGSGRYAAGVYWVKFADMLGQDVTTGTAHSNTHSLLSSKFVHTTGSAMVWNTASLVGYFTRHTVAAYPSYNHEVFFRIADDLSNTEFAEQYADVEIVYPLDEPYTIDLGYIDMPTTFDGGTVRVDAEIQPVIDASWWTKAGYETGKAYNDGNGSADLAALTERVTTAESSITQQAGQIASKVSQSDFNDLEGRMDTAESTITQHAADIEAKVSKNGVIAAINLSTETEGGSAVKIRADKVQIDGTAIFLAISDDVDDAITDKGYQTASQVNTAITSKGYQTSSQVESAITSKGYATTSQAQGYANTAESNAKADTASKLTSYSTTNQMNEAIQNATGPLFYGKENATGYIHLGHVPYVVSSTSNYSHLHLTGRIGGWLSTTSGSIDITFKSRADNAAYNTVDRKDDTVNTSFVDVLVYTGTDGFTHYWLKVNSYWYAQLYAEFEQFVEDDHTRTTTEPDGTCVWKLSEHTAVAAPKANAVKRTQRIYWRSASSLSSWSMPTAWLTVGNDGSHQFGKWTTKVPRMTANADGTGTKYPYLYTCEQREMADGTLAYTTVLLDDSATIIDGGNIITGSLDANKITSGTLTVGHVTNLQSTLDGKASTTVGNPNISPYFEYTPFVNKSNGGSYWHYVNGFVPMENGWAKGTSDNTSGTANAYINMREQAIDALKPSTVYTAMLEVRNYSGSGTTSWVVPHRTASGQVSSFAVEKRVAINKDGVYRLEITSLSDLSNVNEGCSAYIQINAGARISLECRMSLYEGEYDGPWKPYSGSQLYTTDGIVDGKIASVEIGGRNLIGSTDNPTVPTGVNSMAKMTFGDIGQYNNPESEFSIEDYDGSANSIVITSSRTGNCGVCWYTKAGEVKAGASYTFSCRVKSSIAVSVHTHTAWRNGSATAGYTGWTSAGSMSIAANTWTDYSFTFVPASNANLDYEFLVAICFAGNSSGVTFHVAHAKFEKGNKATDWTPAPEDPISQDQVEGLDDDLTDLSNSIQQTSENLSDKLDNELGSFVPDKEKTMEVWGKLTAEEIDVNTLRGLILQAANLILGNPDKVHIDASGAEMAFMNGLDKVAYIDAATGTFYMTKSVVLDDMYFGDGKWKWYKRSNNNMSVKWMG